MLCSCRVFKKINPINQCLDVTVSVFLKILYRSCLLKKDGYTKRRISCLISTME